MESPLVSELLFDGRGHHLGGALPRLMEEDNQLTVAYYAHKVDRPGAVMVGPASELDNLGLVYMAPLDLGFLCRVPDAVLGAMVCAVDGGQRVIVHARDQIIAEHVARWVVTFAGGGHV